MLAGVRFCFLLLLFLTFVFAATLLAHSQISGVPASVTSLGFGGHFTPGPRASVTSLGPNGYGVPWPVFGGWGVNFFLPQNRSLPIVSGHHHRRRDSHDYFPFGMIEPVYVPVPYGVDAGDDTPEDTSSVRASSQRTPTPPDKRAVDADPAPKVAFSVPVSLEPEDPLAEQPSTVLVFKDGHQSDVLNYAIVGDTLFDFGSGRTRKILLADLDLSATRKLNDDRGIDFQIPLSLDKQ
jgi:hypothetical protein